jgi:hypothetical protein
MRMDEIRMDCPCPKTNCERHKDCDTCRAHHGDKKPYCERGYEKKKGASVRVAREIVSMEDPVRV